MKVHDKYGREISDQTPVEVPLGYRTPKPLHILVQELVRSETVRQAAQAAGAETFEEADDFAVEDEELPYSPHELSDFQEETPVSLFDTKKVDKAPLSDDNDDAAIQQHKGEKDGGRKEGVSGVERSGVEDGDAGVSDDGKVGSAAGGKRGSAGKRGG